MSSGKERVEAKKMLTKNLLLAQLFKLSFKKLGLGQSKRTGTAKRTEGHNRIPHRHPAAGPSK